MSSATKKITLRTSDQKVVELDKELEMLSKTLQCMIKDDCADICIDLPKTNNKILYKIIEYCKKYVNTPYDDDFESFEDDFFKVDVLTAIQLMVGADYLNIERLLDLSVRTSAELMDERSPAEIRKAFKIKSHYKPHLKEKIEIESEWSFA